MSKQQDLRIFLVEDEDTLANLYQTALGKIGYVELFHNAEDAIDALLHEDRVNKEHYPHVILLDLIIPEHATAPVDFNSRFGFHVYDHIRDHMHLRHVPVFIMSNLDAVEDRRIALDYGAKHYLVKSNIVPRDIIQHIQEVL